jgi:hypothetical protein
LAVSVTFVFAEYVNRRKRHGWKGRRIFRVVVAVVIAKVATVTVSGVAASAYATGNQSAPSAEPSIATVTVGVAPTVDTIVNSADPLLPDLSATFVD